MINAPWGDDQVDSLNKYQRAAWMHPFTCPNRGDGHHHMWVRDNGSLVATTTGWVCPDCDYTQDWAHEFMTNWSWREGYPFKEAR